MVALLGLAALGWLCAGGLLLEEAAVLYGKGTLDATGTPPTSSQGDLSGTIRKEVGAVHYGLLSGSEPLRGGAPLVEEPSACWLEMVAEKKMSSGDGVLDNFENADTKQLDHNFGFEPLTDGEKAALVAAANYAPQKQAGTTSRPLREEREGLEEGEDGRTFKPALEAVIDGADAALAAEEAAVSDEEFQRAGQEKLTVVMAGYKEARLDFTFDTFREFMLIPNLVHGIIYIWNGGEPAPSIPPDLRQFVTLIFAPLNSLNNKLVAALDGPFETEAVLLMDDDRRMASNLVACMLREWQQDRRVLVGNIERYIHVAKANHDDDGDGDGVSVDPAFYTYGFTGDRNAFHMLLTGGVVTSVRFLSAYRALPDRALAWVDANMNGEDMLFAAVHAYVWRELYDRDPEGRPCRAVRLKVTASQRGVSMELKNEPAIASSKGGLSDAFPIAVWGHARSRCLTAITRAFGEQPVWCLAKKDAEAATRKVCGDVRMEHVLGHHHHLLQVAGARVDRPHTHSGGTKTVR